MKMYTSAKTTKKRKKIIICFLIVCVFAIASYAAIKKLNNSRDNLDSTNDSFDAYINYSPPTEDEQHSGDEQKEEIIATGEQDSNTSLNSENQSQNAADIKKNVTVMITDAGQYGDIIEVRSFIPDHYQDGTCKITFTKDNLTLSKETPAYKDASTTICTNPEFKSSEFKTKGAWRVIVSYESANAIGISDAQEVTIK